MSKPIDKHDRELAHEWVFNAVTAYVLSHCEKWPVALAEPFPGANPPVTDGGPMPEARCPDGAPPNCCAQCYTQWSPLWDICAGDPGCQAQVYAGYLACLNGCIST